MNTAAHTKPICPKCGHVHTSGDAVAAGRFNKTGPVGYIARNVKNADVRATRAEAVADLCAIRALSA